MLKVLIKKQMTEIFRNYFYNAKKNTANSKAKVVGYILLFLALMVGVVGGMFAMVSVSICAALQEAGVPWMYFALLGLIAVVMGAFGSVFNIYSGLYLPKDNDLLLAMPIPVPVLMASRLLSVYLMGLMYSAVVAVPAIMVYWVVADFSVKTVLGGILYLFLISVFVLTLSCVLGWVVAKISAKLKNRSLIAVLISLLFIGGYYFFYFRASQLLQELVQNAVYYGGQIQAKGYPLYLFGMVGVGDGKAALIVTAAVLALFGLTWWVLSRSFLKIATSSGKSERRVYREQAAKPRSVPAALLHKEFGRFLSSPNYMLNCGMGCLFLVAAGIALLWKGRDWIEMLAQVFGSRPGAVTVMLCAIGCGAGSMVDTAAPSVSLEGKSLWLLQSLPVKPWNVLQAKLRLQLLVAGIPMVFCVVCLGIVNPMTAGEFAAAAALLLSSVALMASIGLTLGVKLVNLNWTNELAPIKQGASVALAMLVSFAYPVIFAGVYLLTDVWKLGFAAYAGLFALVTLAVFAALHHWLRNSGSKRFAAL